MPFTNGETPGLETCCSGWCDKEDKETWSWSPSRKTSSFAVPVFVLVAVPPKVVPGKTHKGDKTIKQDPVTTGPFTLTRKLRWMDFVQLVAETINVQMENVSLNALTWHFQNKSSQALPLKSEDSFDVMRKQVKSLKDPSSQIIFVNHPIIKTTLEQVPPTVMPIGTDGVWDQKVSSILCDLCSIMLNIFSFYIKAWLRWATSSNNTYFRRVLPTFGMFSTPRHSLLSVFSAVK